MTKKSPMCFDAMLCTSYGMLVLRTGPQSQDPRERSPQLINHLPGEICGASLPRFCQAGWLA